VGTDLPAGHPGVGTIQVQLHVPGFLAHVQRLGPVCEDASLEITLSRVVGTPRTTRLLWDGTPLRGVGFAVSDVTEEEYQFTFGLRTDEDGHFPTVWLQRGRAYGIRVGGKRLRELVPPGTDVSGYLRWD
jgi:hypothetical protein